MLTQTVLQHHLFCSIIKQKSGYSVCQRLSWLCVMQITIIMTIGTNQRLIVKYRFQYFCIATAEKGSATSNSSGEIYFMLVFPCGLLLQGNHNPLPAQYRRALSHSESCRFPLDFGSGMCYGQQKGERSKKLFTG